MVTPPRDVLRAEHQPVLHTGNRRVRERLQAAGRHAETRLQDLRRVVPADRGPRERRRAVLDLHVLHDHELLEPGGHRVRAALAAEQQQPFSAEIRGDQPVHEPPRPLQQQRGAAGARLHTLGGEVLVRHTLGELEALLAEHGFIRSHRSCLVNVRRVTDLIGGASRDGSLRLDTDETLPVTRRRRAAVEEALGCAPLAS